MRQKLAKNMFLTSVLICSTTAAFAAERDQAKKLYSALTGNTANKFQADLYENLIKQNKPGEAARLIIDSNKGFYNVTLKNFFTPMSNEDRTTFAPLNDMTATMIGVTRDETNFFKIFYEDIMYQFDGELITNDIANLPSKFNKYRATQDWYFLRDLGVAVPKYNRTKNDMYKIAEEGNVPLGDRNYFKKSQQMAYTTTKPGAIAGIFSTRAFAKAFYDAGTNRAPFSNFAKNFMCKDMEELNDITIPDFRVRRDVDRSPGGSSATFKTFCVGCHAGQDGLGGAFTYYDYVDGTMVYSDHISADQNGNVITVGPVAPKINLNNIFPDGRITTSDSWINLWKQGQNEYLGWGTNLSGNGAKDLGKMLSETKQVRTCLSERVFETVCHRKPASVPDKAVITEISNKFNGDGNMKQLFIRAALACIGE